MAVYLTLIQNRRKLLSRGRDKNSLRSLFLSIGPLLTGALFVTLGGCMEEKRASPPPPRVVRVIEADPQPIVFAAEASGQVQARYSTDVGFLVSGRLLARAADVGARVAAGDLIAQIDPVDMQSRLTAARAQLTAAQADLDQAAPQELRYRTLLKDGYTTQARYDDVNRALKTAQARVQGAEANVKLAEDQLKYTQLLAPNNGVITATGADAGQVVNAGQMIVTLAQLDQREAVFSVAAQRATIAQVGMPVRVWLQSKPEATVAGLIREIAPNADPVTGTYTVKVALPDPPDEMRLGSIVVGRAERIGEVLTRIPAGALLQTGSAPQVWVAEGGKVQRRAVTVARYDADSVLLKDGLKKGDQVVVAGVNSLAEGQSVNPQTVAAR